MLNKKMSNLLKIIIFVGIVILTGILLNSLKSLLPFNKDVNRLLLEGIAVVVIGTSFFLFMTKWNMIPLSALSIYPSRSRLKYLGIGFMVGVVMLLAVFVYNVLFHYIDITYLGISANTCIGIALYLVAMLFASIWEEVAFRGYLLQKFSEIIGIHSSCVAIALFFGLLHLLSSLASYQIVISTFLSGILLNYAYFYSKNLYLPIGIHFGWNFFNGLLFSGRIMNVEYLNQFWAGIKNPEQGFIAIIVTGIVAICFLVCFSTGKKSSAWSSE